MYYFTVRQQGRLSVKMKPLQIMFLGTGSDVGKSVIAAGFCRILKRQGYSVAPFKAQNMALNSFVTATGDEMGRAQVMQAYAAGIQPSSDMNPILLKPTGESTVQVIVQGRVLNSTDARKYYAMKEQILQPVLESYQRLAEKYNAIVLEGAGSTAEINLKNKDIVNIEMALRAHAPVIIIADIDKGGVFAALIGTMNLLRPREKRLVIGFIINKFRGDRALFEDGIRFIEKKTKRPVFGIVPFFSDIHLPEEDSVALQYGRKGGANGQAEVRIAVVHLPYISNYTDFDPFELEDKVELSYIRRPEDLSGNTVVILPGTKNTIHDLLWLKQQGFESALREHVAAGNTLIGICGGYQMLGTHIADPFGVETNLKKAQGLGFLNSVTTLQQEKTLTSVRGFCNITCINKNQKKPLPVEGYEIHMGKTETSSPVHPAFFLKDRNSFDDSLHPDGALHISGKVWGTYLHGLFENDEFRYHFLQAHGRSKCARLNYRDSIEKMYDKLADIIENNVNVQSVLNAAHRF